MCVHACVCARVCVCVQNQCHQGDSRLRPLDVFLSNVDCPVHRTSETQLTFEGFPVRKLVYRPLSVNLDLLSISQGLSLLFSGGLLLKPTLCVRPCAEEERGIGDRKMSSVSLASKRGSSIVC